MFRDWLRRIFIDPELERKAHEFVNKANKTADHTEKVAADAEKMIRDIKRKLATYNVAEIVLVVIFMFIASGAVIGYLHAQTKPSKPAAI